MLAFAVAVAGGMAGGGLAVVAYIYIWQYMGGGKHMALGCRVHGYGILILKPSNNQKESSTQLVVVVAAGALAIYARYYAG